MSANTIRHPAWWVRTICVVVLLGLYAGLAWGKGWWQDRWAPFVVGLVFSLMYLILYWRVPDRRMQSRAFYFGSAALSFTVSALNFGMFLLRSKGSPGLLAFLFLAMGFRSVYLHSLVSRQNGADSGIESLHLDNHG